MFNHLSNYFHFNCDPQITLVQWNEPYQKLASCDSSGIIFVWIKFEGRWSIELINDRNTPVTHFSWSHDGRMALICYQVFMIHICHFWNMSPVSTIKFLLLFPSPKKYSLYLLFFIQSLLVNFLLITIFPQIHIFFIFQNLRSNAVVLNLSVTFHKIRDKAET